MRIGSRAGSPPFDWTEPDTWANALHDVGSVYLTFQPDLAVRGAAATVAAFAELAQRSGVDRLVLLSGRGEPEAQRSEQAVRDVVDDWTIVRASWLNQNFSESFLLPAVLAGQIELPAGAASEPFVDADDIADVAVAALTQGSHRHRLYEVTGPRLLTFADAAREIATATGRQVRYRPISPPQFAAALAEQQVPTDITALLTELFTVTLDGRNAYVTDGVREALGRPALDFGAYARDAAANRAWDDSGPPAPDGQTVSQGDGHGARHA